MVIKDNFKQREIGATNSRRIREMAPILILLYLIAHFVISCGDDPSSPVTPETGFEWTNAPPEEHGFDPYLLDTLTQKISARTFGRITSLLIVRNGYLVYEEYFRGYTRDSLVDIYSCTKSVASALMGIAIDEGSIGGVDDRLFDYLDGYNLFPHGSQDSVYRESMTLEHLLTMTSGFSWEEMDIRYGEPGNIYNEMVNSEDWIQFTLDRPVEFEPGATFEYNTGLSGLMAVVLQNSTGQRADDYARDKLFRRIGINKYSWRMTPKGLPMTGNGLKLRPRDMAKFGWLYSQKGVFNGDTVVPSWWVQASHQPHFNLPDGRSYGYQWWLAPLADDPGNPIMMPYAMGYGHQHIIVPPVYDLVIVITADNRQDFPDSYILDIISHIGDAFTP